MIYDTDTVNGIINRVISRHIKFMVPREGQVKDLNDPEELGRVLVQVSSLGWDTNDKAAWCHGTDKNLLSTVKIDDYVIIQFVDGNRDFPICIGKSNRIKDMIPKNYDGKPTTHILFESPADKIVMKYDEESDLLQIGKKDFKSSARNGDKVMVTIPAGTYIESVSGGSGTPAVGVPNAVPLDVEGTIQEGSSQVEVGDK